MIVLTAAECVHFCHVHNSYGYTAPILSMWKKYCASNSMKSRARYLH